MQLIYTDLPIGQALYQKVIKFPFKRKLQTRIAPMPEIKFTKHAKHMLTRRNIMEEWVWQVINTPETKWQSEDGNMHYSKAIPEKEGRILHVVVNINVQPNRIVTLFFDRRLEKKK